MHDCVDTRARKDQYECVNRNSLFLLGFAVLAVVGLAVWLFGRPDCEPPAKYVLELHGSKVAHPGDFVDAIVTSGPKKKAIFRHSLTYREVDNGPAVVPTGYEDDGPSPCPCKRRDSKYVGMHVTQSVGFNKLDNLQAVLAALEH